MAPSPCIELAATERDLLLRIARAALAGAVDAGAAAPPWAENDLPPALTRPAGAFVTLSRERRLRGCIGALESTGTLARTVADAARDAALRDPRFPAVTAAELPDVRVEVSVLSSLQPLQVDSHDALLAALRPGSDGLLIIDGEYRATFLPKVWEQLPTADLFLAQLLAKAGLPAGHWSAAMRCLRYTAVSFGEDD